MKNIFFVSDQHFGHANILNFKRSDGITPLRDFSCVEEMNEYMIACHNSVVKPEDRVYMLGDLAMSKKHLPILDRLSGRKVLIKGNHDIEKLSVYAQYFDDVRGSHQFDGMLLTHIPVHPASLARWGFNVHGHLHANSVTKEIVSEHTFSRVIVTATVPDTRYKCVSVEQINYTPISLEEVRKFKPKVENEPRIR